MHPRSQCRVGHDFAGSGVRHWTFDWTSDRHALSAAAISSLPSMAEGFGTRLMDPMESMIPDAVAEHFGK